MEMTASSPCRRTPRTPVESRPSNTRTSSALKRMARPQRGGQQDVVLGGAEGDADDVVALVQLHGDLAGAVDVGEVADSLLRRTSPERVANMTS